MKLNLHVKSISIECLFDMVLDKATIGVEQNKPIFTPGVANFADVTTIS